MDDCGSAKPAFFTRDGSGGGSVSLLWAGLASATANYCCWPTLYELNLHPYQCSLSGLARNGSRNTFDLEFELYTTDIPR
jgi:hypothetical protein